MKKLFTPFSVAEAGSLTNVLKYVGPKPDVEGKPMGRYQGFRDDERVYAPKKIVGKYEKSAALSSLMDTDDQLYINAHCRRGLDYVSTKQSCGDGKQVKVADLILQLQALGLKDGELPTNRIC